MKEEREAKRAQLDGRHDYVFNIVASCLGLEKADVEDAILEGTQVKTEKKNHCYRSGALWQIINHITWWNAVGLTSLWQPTYETAQIARSVRSGFMKTDDEV